MADAFDRDERTRVRRLPDRGTLRKEDIYAILDGGFLCHVGFEVDGQPFVIPTLYARAGDQIFLHGSAASRMLRHLDRGVPVSVCVTHVDGIVLAKSAFHHSVNYRSAILFGTATALNDETAKVEALRLFTNWMVPGRWEELRATTAQELRATTVLCLQIEHASGKIRSGPPKDDPEDASQPVWSGVLPISSTFHAPIPYPESCQQLQPFDLGRMRKFAAAASSRPT